MTQKSSLRPGLAAFALALGITACAPEKDSGEVHAQTQTAEVAQPTTEGVIRRSEERWNKIVAAGDDPAIWVEIYEYETPLQKTQLSLPRFLEKKADFVYDSPTKPKLLLMEDGIAYLDVSAQWLAGRHPMIAGADIGGDSNMIEHMELIEQWQWVSGEWHLVKPIPKNEFFRQNPDFLARAQAASEKQNSK